MNIAVIGTGAVGQSLSKKFLELGHRVFMGTRDIEKSRSRKEIDQWGTPGVGAWMENYPKVELVTFQEAAKNGKELLVFAMNGKAAMDALEAIGKEHLDGKIMIDISNPLDFSKGFPPVLSVCNTESLGEQIQNAYPDLKVVKALNSISHPVMANPGVIEGDHNTFICGNDEGAKDRVKQVLEELGWKPHNIVDLGDITNARGTEMLLPLYLRLMNKFETPMFNINVVKAKEVTAPGRI